MQVLLAFADAREAVLTREDLMRTCWPGMVVGDDSINRAIAEIRRMARVTGAGFAIETIPRIGYRLTGGVAADPGAVPETDAHSVPVPAAATSKASRRWMVGGALAAAGAGGFGLWTVVRPKPDPRFLEAMDRGNQVLRLGLGTSAQSVEFFRKAVAIKPDDAAAWGLLAVGHQRVSGTSSRQAAGVAAQACEQAARRALALNRREPNALAALALLQRKLDDWLTTEKRLRDVLAIDAGNMAALDALVALWQSAGFIRESWDLNERAIARDPLRPILQQRRALKHWIMGRPLEAGQTIERAFELWSWHPLVWNSRLLIYAFTGRTQAALAMIDDETTASRFLTRAGIAAWRISLRAVATRSVADVSAARAVNLEAAPTSAALSVHAIMILSELNELDAAYSIIDGLLLKRGSVLTQPRADSGQTPANDPQWRQTQWLYTPATRLLRVDPRFGPLCDAIGLTEYWRRRGVGPDERRSNP